MTRLLAGEGPALPADPVTGGSAPATGLAPAGAAGVRSTQTPPFGLPGEHFVAGFCFFLAGAIGLLLTSDELARGLHFSPRLVVVTHLFTLGWITTSIMGALYQFLPVALGTPIRSVRVAHLTFLLCIPGTTAFLGGMLFGRPGPMIAGAAVMCGGLLLFLGNFGATLRASRERGPTWWALVGAAVFLGVTLVLGLALTGNQRWGYLGANRVGALGVHMHVALAGWVLLVMIGVARHLLPMFLLSHGAGDGYTKISVTSVISGAGVLTLLHHGPPLLRVWLPALLIGGGLAAFLVQARRFYRRRRRPAVDAGMKIAAGGLLLLGLGLVLAVAILLGGSSPRLATAYGLTMILGISLFVAGHYYKIVPFLVWYHRYGPLAGKRPLPLVAELYSSRGAHLSGVGMFAGALGLVAAVLVGSPALAAGAATLFVVGVGIQGAQMLIMLRKSP